MVSVGDHVGNPGGQAIVARPCLAQCSSGPVIGLVGEQGGKLVQGAGDIAVAELAKAIED